MKLIVMAAGNGTRFLPFTKEMPKALIPILSKPLVEYTVDLCIPHITGIIFVINKNLGFKIKEYFGLEYKGIPIIYVTQDLDESKGTFSALLCAMPYIDTDNFVVCNCDDLYKKEDIDKAFKNKEIGVGVTNASMPYFYHGIDIKNGYINGFRRHEKIENLVNDKFMNGFYYLSRSVFSFRPISIRNGEIGLPHTLFENIDSYPLKEIVFSEWVAVDGPNNIPLAEDFIRKNYLNN